MADVAWIQDRIAATKTIIVAYEGAILALAQGAQSYKLNTGQTDQWVSKANLAEMTSTLKTMRTLLAEQQNELAAAQGAQATAFRVIPGW